MKQQTYGFTLIEITIALFISSMLTLLLYQSFSQAQRAARNSSALIDAVTAMPIAYNQLEKDFTTIFVPARVFSDIADKAQKKEGASSPAQTTASSPEESDKKPKEPFKDIFVSTLQEKNLAQLSFISTHSLALYNTVVPHAVRVLYRLMPTVDNPKIFTLVRQETTTLDMPLKKFKEEKVREYDLMRGVKELRVELLVPEKEPEAEQQPGQEKQEQKQTKQEQQPKKYITLDKWEGDSEKGDKKTEHLIPAYIHVIGVLIDPATEREYPFEWRFAVPVFDDVVLRVKQAKTKKPATNQQPATQQQTQPADGKQPQTQQRATNVKLTFNQEANGNKSTAANSGAGGTKQ